VVRLFVLPMLAGCSSILGIHDLQRTDGGSGNDDVGADVPVLNCLNETFSGSAVDPTQWTVTDPSPHDVTENGELVITMSGAMTNYQRINSVAMFDASEGDFYIDVPEIVDQGGYVENGVSLISDAQNFLSISAGAGSMRFRARVNGTNMDTTPGADPMLEHWRINHSGSTATFYTSPNGTSWTVRATAPVSTTPTAVTIQLWAGTYGTSNPTPGAARYDNARIVNAACP